MSILFLFLASRSVFLLFSCDRETIVSQKREYSSRMVCLKTEQNDFLVTMAMTGSWHSNKSSTYHYVRHQNFFPTDEILFSMITRVEIGRHSNVY